MILESVPISERLTLYVSTGSNATLSSMILNSTKIEVVLSSNVMVWSIGAADGITSVCVVGPVDEEGEENEEEGEEVKQVSVRVVWRKVEEVKEREGKEGAKGGI